MRYALGMGPAQTDESVAGASLHARASKEPGVGTSAVIVRDGKILLGLRRGSHGAGMWATPGGHLEHGESFLECITREVLEETGLVVASCHKLAFTNDILPADNKHYVTLYFLCEEQGGEPQLLEPDKCMMWQWFDLQDLPENIWMGLPEALARLREVSDAAR